MEAQTQRRIMLRDLETVRREIEAFADEKQIWEVPAGIANSAGTLALHVAGNLQHFVGAGLGNTGYIRERDLEFSRRDVPRAEILAELAAAEKAVDEGLGALSAAATNAPFPLPFGAARFRTGEFLSHLVSHLAHHAGQINYLRRIVTGKKGDVTPMIIDVLEDVSGG